MKSKKKIVFITLIIIVLIIPPTIVYYTNNQSLQFSADIFINEWLKTLVTSIIIVLLLERFSKYWAKHESRKEFEYEVLHEFITPMNSFRIKIMEFQLDWRNFNKKDLSTGELEKFNSDITKIYLEFNIIISKASVGSLIKHNDLFNKQIAIVEDKITKVRKYDYCEQHFNEVIILIDKLIKTSLNNESGTKECRKLF